MLTLAFQHAAVITPPQGGVTCTSEILNLVATAHAARLANRVKIAVLMHKKLAAFVSLPISCQVVSYNSYITFSDSGYYTACYS